MMMYMSQAQLRLNPSKGKEIALDQFKELLKASVKANNQIIQTHCKINIGIIVGEDSFQRHVENVKQKLRARAEN